MSSEALATGQASWRDIPERGSTLGIVWLVRIATALGRRPARLLVHAIAFYYALVSPRARRAIRTFRTQMGLSSGFGAAYRQILRFSEVALDALFFVQGDLRPFEISRDGHLLLAELRDSGTGAVLLGAHFGSFYAMRGQGHDESLKLHPLVFTGNARRINDVLERLDPRATTQLVQMKDGDVSVLLKVRELVERGGLVAILADRVPPSGKSVTVDFLGKPAQLPTGPFLLAATLRCPVYLTYSVYRPPNRYELHCERFAETIELPRGQRTEAVQKYAQAYADRLSAWCDEAPDNWFNFYDFWAAPDGSA